jgi:hypothetical protein
METLKKKNLAGKTVVVQSATFLPWVKSLGLLSFRIEKDLSGHRVMLLSKEI